MKKLLLVMMLLVGCTQVKDVADDIGKKDPVVSGTVTPKDTIELEVGVLAWGTSHPEWDKALIGAVYELPNVELKKPCTKLTTRDCAIQLLSIMAKFESSFKPETSFNETGHLQGVVSRGLLQISKDSANQSAYGCGITDAKELHDPKVNLECAVKILAYQAKNSGTLMDGKKGGCSAYWSVCRADSGSYKKILEYLKDK